MEKLWSPWRSQYIESFKEKKAPAGCIFCGAKDEDMNAPDSLVVVKNKLTMIVMNLYPYNNGHLMIVPYRHISEFDNLTAEERIEIFSEVERSIKALKITVRPEGFNIGANLGKAAGAGIDTHLHFHVVPRWNGDTNFMPVLGEIKVLSQDLLKGRDELREAFKVL